MYKNISAIDNLDFVSDKNNKIFITFVLADRLLPSGYNDERH